MLAIDISSHNPVTSWPALLGSVDILIVKITQAAGVAGYVWDGASAALAQGRAAGKCIGAYHFYGGGSGTAEADFFLAHYAWRLGEVPILDWEPAKPPADPDGVAAAFCQRIRDRLGVAPLVYMSGSAARSQAWPRTRAASCGLWVAQYGANTGQPGTAPAVGSWGAWAGWQYTSNGTRPGVSGLVDLSTFTGDAAAWRAYGTPGGTDMAGLSDADVTKLYWGTAFRGTANFAQVIDAIQDAAAAAAAQLTGAAGTLNGDLRADLSAKGAALAAILEAVGKVQAPQVDASALAAALVAQPGFIDGLVSAVVPALAADVAHRLGNG